MKTAVTKIDEAYARIRQADRPEIWIALREEQDVRAEAAEIDARVAAGERLPLAGVLVAVKDNIDVAGLPTTAGSPAYAYSPAVDAPAVERLRIAGAIVLGKTNLDQFATGLVGTRSPYGPVRNAWRPDRISGGSSSGSAVAVALSLVDISLGTDTAGSGRVPAALNGIVGIKPTIGLVPATGVVPACRSLDCVTVFARDLALGRRAIEIMSGPDGVDPRCRTDLPAAPLDAAPRIAVPTAEHLDGLAEGWAEAFEGVVAQLESAGVEIVEVDIAPLLDAAALLYGGAFVAERTAAVGDFIRDNPALVGPDIDPTVAQIVLGGDAQTATQYFRDRETLDRLKLEGLGRLDGAVALLTPTTTWHPTLDEVAADPIGANSKMGRYTNFANLMDLSALAVPAGIVGGLPFGVMLTGAAFADRTLAEIGRLIQAPALDVLVVGAHLSGQPLNHQLVAAGATFLRETRTAPEYRMYALDTVPPKPGLERVAEGGAPILGEVWRLPAAGFGRFVAALPQPMAVGQISLEDGTAVTGFQCEPVATGGARDISEFGGWRDYLDTLTA
ncbi:allophanate hydrolase [Microbacterium indicum]|uniref:allophanate hydrolase n=1 Tax=Microbacterium indicum TaxID=358100 RepID=UPI00048B7376|nr:allophanate hydrolase [Microbacterium indicum]